MITPSIIIFGTSCVVSVIFLSKSLKLYTDASKEYTEANKHRKEALKDLKHAKQILDDAEAHLIKVVNVTKRKDNESKISRKTKE